MKISETKFELLINSKFVPVNGAENIKEGDVFRIVNADGNPVTSHNVWSDKKYFSSVMSWRAAEDAMIDINGNYSVDAVPEEAVQALVKYGEKSLAVPKTKMVLGGSAIAVIDLVGLGILAPMLVSGTTLLSVFAGLAIAGSCLLLTGAFVIRLIRGE